MTEEVVIPLIQAKEIVTQWIEDERSGYAVQKWEEDNADRQAEVIENGEWLNFPYSYLQRAKGMTLKSLQGRQALGKVITSCTSLLERAVSIYGDMPMPGVSSTEGAKEWVREPAESESGRLPGMAPVGVTGEGQIIFVEGGSGVATYNAADESQEVADAIGALHIALATGTDDELAAAAQAVHDAIRRI